MKFYSVYDPEFCEYGQILEGYEISELMDAMRKIPVPEEGGKYMPGIDSLEACSIYTDLQDRAFGGMPIQVGLCWGHNTRLNCLEYHRDSEINLGTEDFILLLGLRSQIRDGFFDTADVKAFRIPAGVMIEVYATSLHFAPCHTTKDGFHRTLVVLPKGTNTEMPEFEPKNEEDRLMTARNKWLLAHEDSPAAKNGARVGLRGENIDIANWI